MEEFGKPTIEKVEVEKIYFPDEPEVVWNIPSGRPGFFIQVSENPYTGIELKIKRYDPNSTEPYG